MYLAASGEVRALKVGGSPWCLYSYTKEKKIRGAAPKSNRRQGKTSAYMRAAQQVQTGLLCGDDLGKP